MDGRSSSSGVSRRRFLIRSAGLVGITSFGMLSACQSATPAAPAATSGAAAAGVPASTSAPAAAKPTTAAAAATSAPAAAATSAPAVAKQHQTLTIGYDVDIDNLDPQQAQSAGSEVPSAVVFRRLAEFTNTQDADKSGVAESWELKDPTTYVFKLRQGVKFHSGREMTAEDVEYSWQRGFDIGPKGRFAGYMVTVESGKATGKYEFTVKLKRPDALLVANTCVGAAAVVDKESIDSIGTKPSACGPYKFVEWQPGEQHTYEKFADYYDKQRLAGYPDRIVVKVIKDEQARIAALKAGQVDIVPRVSPALSADIEKTPSLRLLKQPFSASYQCVAFNLRHPPFDNLKLRQGLSRAVNRDVINKNVWFGTGEVGCGPLPSTHWAYTSLSCPTFDLAAAKQMIADSGVQLPIKVDFGFWNFPEQIKIAEILKNDWKDLGLDLDLRPLETASYIADVWNGKKADMTIAWYTREPDPDGAFSSVLRKEQGNNFMGYDNPSVDALFDQGRSETDQAKRKAIYEQIIQTGFLADVPLIKMQTIEIQWAANQAVQMPITPQGSGNWVNLKIA
jgi:peptide/nickel transport system substrate-binding protein